MSTKPKPDEGDSQSSESPPPASPVPRDPEAAA